VDNGGCVQACPHGHVCTGHSPGEPVEHHALDDPATQPGRVCTLHAWEAGDAECIEVEYAVLPPGHFRCGRCGVAGHGDASAASPAVEAEVSALLAGPLPDSAEERRGICGPCYVDLMRGLIRDGVLPGRGPG